MTMLSKKIKGVLKYTVDPNHPDYKYLTDKQRHGVNTCSDVYVFSIYDPIDNPGGYWGADDIVGMQSYIENDLSLIAGGGYDSDHIHNEQFSFSEV